MLKRISQLPLVACLATAGLWAADNPFVGDWKLNPSKSKLTDVMKVESLGGNNYGFDLGGSAEKIAVDGTDLIPGSGGEHLDPGLAVPCGWRTGGEVRPLRPIA